jgi:hypothetical protein
VQYNQHKYAVAQVENMKNVVRELRYSPTFAIYKDGKKVCGACEHGLRAGRAAPGVGGAAGARLCVTQPAATS